MKRHPEHLIGKIKFLRAKGNTYAEINKTLGIDLAKSTLHWMCRTTPLPPNYLEKITALNIKNLGIARATSLAVRSAKKEELLKNIFKINSPIAKLSQNTKIAKIILSILCLGEASKSTRGSVFSLGNTDPKVLHLFLDLMKICFSDFNPKKIRCTIQCRADQNIKQLERFWQVTLNIPKSNFYKTRIDSRTIGKPTLRKHYKGVLKIDYLDTKKQLELESLADLLYNQVHSWALSSFG